jgi:hypothetical protein
MDILRMERGRTKGNQLEDLRKYQKQHEQVIYFDLSTEMTRSKSHIKTIKA